PAADDVQAEAPFADVVRGDELLGRDHRMDEGRVHGAEHRKAFGCGQQAGGPGHGLQGFALVVGVAAVTLPPADRQHELEAGLVGHARETQTIGPTAAPAFRDLRHGAARRTVGAEQAKLQIVAAVERQSIMHTHWKEGATCCAKRAISSFTWSCGFRPTLKYRMTSSKPAASTFFSTSVICAGEPSSTEFSVRSSGRTLCSRSTM